MNVAIDARELCGKPTGVGRYLGELLAEWAVSPEARRHVWTLYAPTLPSVPAAFRDRVQVLPGGAGTAWEQWTLARRLAADRPDVLFSPGYTAPLTAPCPTVVAIHDVSFAAHPEWFGWREGLRRRLVTRWSAARARTVLTISAFSHGEIVRRLGQPPGHVRVIPLGARLPMPPVEAGPRPPLILHVGTLLPRRHVDALVDAFVRDVAPVVADARLEIVGENRMPAHTPLTSRLDAVPADVRARVRFRSYVDEATLEALYHEAAVFAFLSEYEGFGLTPLEAMARGAAPVVLETPVSREVYGEAATFVGTGPGLEARLGPTLRHLLTDEPARAALIARAPAVLSRYDWTRTAVETLAVLEDAAGAR